MPRPDPIVMALARRRHALGLSQLQVARRMGYVAHGIVEAWENGKRSPGLDKVQRWADALGCDLGLTVREEANRA